MKTSLSDNLRLGLSRKDPVIRAITIVALIALLGICVANATAAEPDKPAADKPIEELVGEGQTDYESYNKVVKALRASQKETEEAKQQAAGLQAQNQYLAVLAERNEMAVRLLQANARADDLQKQLDAEKAKVADLEKKPEAPKK